MIPPGVWDGGERRRWPDEVGSFGGPKGADDASGKSAHARCARDLRLKFSAGLATREIARRLGVAPSTVRETLRRLSMSGLSWPVAEGLSEAELEGALYGGRGSKRGRRLHAEPDWPAIRRELKRKHVTLQIVWDEYIAAHPGGLQLQPLL